MASGSQTASRVVGSLTELQVASRVPCGLGGERGILGNLRRSLIDSGVASRLRGLLVASGVWMAWGVAGALKGSQIALGDHG